MKQLIVLLACLLVVSECARRCERFKIEAKRPDVCVNPFTVFIECLAEKIERRVRTIISDADVEQLEHAKQCFNRNNCGPIRFNEETALRTFFPCDPNNDKDDECLWRRVIDRVLAVLRDIPPAVSKCMINYFKGIGGRKIEQCTVEYPPPSGPLRPKFTMPEIPGFDNFQVEDFKNVILYRMMVRHQLLECACDGGGNTQNVINCLVQTTTNEETSVCRERQDCENKIPTGACKNRYHKVHDSACSCAKTELSKGLVAAFENWGELKQLVLQGQLECEFKHCYTSNGLGHLYGDKGDGEMHDKFQSAKRAVIRAVVRILAGGAKLPPQLKHALAVFKSVLDEITARWAGVFCSDCSKKTESNSDIQRQNYKLMIDENNCDAEASVEQTGAIGGAIDEAKTGRQNGQVRAFGSQWFGGN